MLPTGPQWQIATECKIQNVKNGIVNVIIVGV